MVKKITIKILLSIILRFHGEFLPQCTEISWTASSNFILYQGTLEIVILSMEHISFVVFSSSL